MEGTEKKLEKYSFSVEKMTKEFDYLTQFQFSPQREIGYYHYLIPMKDRKPMMHTVLTSFLRCSSLTFQIFSICFSNNAL